MVADVSGHIEITDLLDLYHITLFQLAYEWNQVKGSTFCLIPFCCLTFLNRKPRFLVTV